MFFVRRTHLPENCHNKTNEYVAMVEDEQIAEAIKRALNVGTDRKHTIIELRSWPLSMSAALDCGQTYLTKPLDRADNYLI
jgi:hypothetical protein